MRTSSAVLIVGVCLGVVAACKKKEAAPVAVQQADAGDEATFEVGSDERRLAFEIVATYRNQSVSKAPPFHVDGGAWTFFDAKTADGIFFGFGFDRPSSGDMPMASVVLTVPDRGHGKRLVDSIARTFGGEIPAEKEPQPLAPRPFRAVFLGTDLVRTNKGFGGHGGGYSATKLFLERGALQAEVFFNFNLEARRGEFAEKDADYANPMAALLATELRDGPRPRRTPANDATMTDKGPRIDGWRTIEGRGFHMSPEGDRYWVIEPTEGRGERMVSVGFTRPDDREEVFRLPNGIFTAQCSKTICLVQDKVMRPGNLWRSNDPSQLLLFDRSKKTLSKLEGPWGDLPSIPDNAVASDGSLMLVSTMLQVDTVLRRQVFYFVGRDGKVRGPIDPGDDKGVYIRPIAIEASRVVLEKTSFTSKEKPTYLSIDRATTKVSPMDPPPQLASGRVSPDGKFAVSCDGAKEIRVTELATRKVRSIPIDEQDQLEFDGACVTWASSRYLEYAASSLHGFIDVTTMKLSDAFPTTDTPTGPMEYDRTFHFVVGRDEHALRLGRVLLP
ncbi:hypothetical protein LZC95_34515 [Pendulispora brunnea]|uniref:Uncharacterized protein n=1 Tax=Pendulispora brunnea TaxID=2905690 RepID=A0ABZ2JYI6_9BACT